MKHIFTFLILIITIQSTKAQFNKYFTKEALRIDFTLSGTAKTTQATLFKTIKEKQWGGNPNRLITPFNYGTFRIVMHDAKSNKIIFSQGFCTLFEEWKATVEASNSTKSFKQTMQCPYPKDKVLVDIDTRDEHNKFITVNTFSINPKSSQIIKQNTIAKTHKLINNGSSAKCVDIAIIAEGYSKDEMDLFHKDVKRLSDYMFTMSPFSKYKNKFNIWMIDAISKDSGISDPRKYIWKNTALKTSFNTLNSDRYLETLHTYTVRDYAALVPYDQIYILANTKKYGGGGIYNHFCTTSAHNDKSEPVFVHEFGHAFAGLADEYSTDISYSDLFNSKKEPWQPNLTTLVNFKSKWKNMMNKKTPIPTPIKDKYQSTIGVYEGGGYSSKGVYRPYINCRMNTNTAPAFCPVCQKAIEDVIISLTK